MGFRVLLSLLLLTSFTINTFAADVGDNVSWTQSPHHAPSHQPVAAPAPHHHHHHHPHHAPSYQPVAAPAPHHHHHHKLATSHAPSKAPAHAPVPVQVQPPTKAPVQPPTTSPAPVLPPLPPRKLVAIQGVVYCKACKYKGVDTLIGAKPLQGAEVLLTCNNTKYPLRVKGTTDKNGYFFIKPPKTLTTYGSHRCRVSLLSSPMATCNQPTDLHAGVKGSLLMPNKKPPLSSPDAHPLPYDVFSVGPFAFEASSKTPCAKESLED
ncbi:putative pistil-specific extensin-like protein [Helianthus annuus]|uniref:Pistil-specific extensin-like protein n=1 Tax=Helianthus annuus TaxID=4232 RepID=A0A251RZP4_HELAN|nr:non-classical arabinogalactan protein 31 [Helianthus annuus]KAF5760724.1 putative pistil-specific extensin-like protein [Helianthus annuus]KAJ0821875.1 putative pistil-specific extensin-like protein [Helianthus annuus]